MCPTCLISKRSPAMLMPTIVTRNKLADAASLARST